MIPTLSGFPSVSCISTSEAQHVFWVGIVSFELGYSWIPAFEELLAVFF
jgi:hypothetical protein